MGIISIGRWTPNNYNVINVTSRSPDKWRRLSPFWSTEVPLHIPGMQSLNLPPAHRPENIWQGLKSWSEICTVEDFDLDFAYGIIYADRPIRYPMGKGAKCFCHVDYDGRRLLDYITARKFIYLPVYREAVLQQKDLIQELVDRSHNENIALWDFDSYAMSDIWGVRTITQALNYPHKAFGHSLALCIILSEQGAKLDVPL